MKSLDKIINITKEIIVDVFEKHPILNIVVIPFAMYGIYKLGMYFGSEAKEFWNAIY